ncbi:HlyD family efflux transporter periplasmic adaptor subunit [Pseudobacteroides cellulosolvens]|uniref:Secretion protein HlyD family protein n=1 Tax=Pseudobacteroides cellulosolvens ATCC 35603 = DSM 2933 TaxID=398512 RepID=A0A0L6JRV2_9FIRM|nr:HlyD family efflux transporter periplasmic adaptor subunit [Pseudobacteroides cellulosolvens]KNY28425.1 secretion protein HlyD family protein [Pseudobacteroides cellulosolvens ATCC 35603 = DSM 2933]
MKKVFGKIKGLFGKKLIKVLIVLIVLGSVGFGLVKFDVIKIGSKTTSTSQQQRTTRVQKGTISQAVTGSGYIEPANKVDISTSVSGTITKVYFKDKDNIKAGDLLYELDDSDAKLNYEKAKNNLALNQVTANDNQRSITELSISAPISGRVSNFTLKLGDEIGKGANILSITDTSKLKITVPFNASLKNEVQPGQKAVLHIQELMQSVNGVVTYIGSNPYPSASGGQVFDVEVTFDNPGALKEGLRATVSVSTSSGSHTSTDAGKMEYVNVKNIKSTSGGTVRSINVRENSHVNAGDVLIEMENDDLSLAKQNSDLKILDASAQVESAKKQLSYYKVYASIDGIIMDQTKKVGDNVKAGDILGNIIDMKNLQFDVDIDELDIDKIKAGQKVNITVDALTETNTKPLSGEVSKIAFEGTSSNGVSVYPVTIKVNDIENLRIGMNVNASIMVLEKPDVLMVPIEAVTKFGNRSSVWVRSSGTNQGSDIPGPGGDWGGNSNGNSSNSNGEQAEGNNSNRRQRPQSNDSQEQQSGNDRSNRQGVQGTGNSNRMMQRNSAMSEYYKGAVPKQVTLGINNDSYIEVLSGLEEGDIVILPPLTTSGSAQSTTNQSGFRMGVGGMTGGMPGGGMPGGSSQRSSTRQSGGQQGGQR